jgi:malic enzyme
VFCGAGSAGAGAITFLHNTLVDKFGMDPLEAADLFYILDKDGLISADRENLEELK